ncbi:ABC transporter permease [Streptomyces sp. cg36]|uniref:ABC transporter permease n=1 Tax=Streptomyces sp. cg36 TaxID=3238798 RepID=UPI0034E299DA
MTSTRVSLDRVLVAARFHTASMWNWRQVYYGRIIEPVTYFVFLAVGIGGALASADGRHPEDYLSFVIPGMIAMLAFRSSTAAMSDVANDRKWGVFAFYRMYGGGVAGYLASILIVLTGMFLVQLALILVIAVPLGGLVGTSGGRLASALATGVLASVGWTAVGAAVATRVHSYATRNLIVSVITLPVILAAPLFYPLKSAPEYLKIIARVDPLTYQVDWLRDVWSGSLDGLLWSAIWALLTSAGALSLLRRADPLTSER